MKPRRSDLAYVDAVQNEDAELLLSGRPSRTRPVTLSVEWDFQKLRRASVDREINVDFQACRAEKSKSLKKKEKGSEFLSVPKASNSELWDSGLKKLKDFRSLSL